MIIYQEDIDRILRHTNKVKEGIKKALKILRDDKNDTHTNGSQ